MAKPNPGQIGTCRDVAGTLTGRCRNGTLRDIVGPLAKSELRGLYLFGSMLLGKAIPELKIQKHHQFFSSNKDLQPQDPSGDSCPKSPKKMAIFRNG